MERRGERLGRLEHMVDPAIGFLRVSEAKTAGNRFHVDLRVAGEPPRARAERVDLIRTTVDRLAAHGSTAVREELCAVVVERLTTASPTPAAGRSPPAPQRVAGQRPRTLVELNDATLVIDVDHVNIDLAPISMRVDERRVVDDDGPALLPFQLPAQARSSGDRAMASDVCSVHQKIQILVAAGREERGP